LSDSSTQPSTGDRHGGTLYVYTEQIRLAVDVALATGRPLLVRGATGSGKSSLARFEAAARGWRYYEQTITSRTQARDLLWEIDHLRRLQDAHSKELGDDLTPYVRPGILWWAFNRPSAREQAGRCRTMCQDPNRGDDHPRAVVLLDEIDKADPDVPNNLLVPLGSFVFQIEDTGATVEVDVSHQPLLIITTNDERDLPAAFLRRCIELRIATQSVEELLKIAKAHFPEETDDHLKDILAAIVDARPSEWRGVNALPSPAELIDNIVAVRKLPNGDKAKIAGLVVWKESQSGRVAG